jgi:hypothetical protein
LISRGRIEHAGGIENERLVTGGRVVACRVLIERLNPCGRVLEASCVEIERIKTKGRVVGAVGGKTEEGVRSLGRVVARIASVRCRANPESIRGRRKRKPCER